MAPPQILEAEHACGVSCARCGYARAAAYGKVCHMFRSQRTVCLYRNVFKYLPCINVVGVREAKKHTIACSSIIPRALVRLSTYLSPV